MICSKLDLFSQPFLFKINNNQLKKGTIQGVITSLGIFGIMIAYFVYLTMQYFGNKFDPIFRSQSFVTNDLIEIPFHEDLVAFQLIQSPGKTIEQYQKEMNLTYVVPLATIGYQNKTQYDNFYVKVIECSNPQLQGYHCLDFSNQTIKNLVVNTNQHIFSVISIYIYSCQVIDNIKTFMPNNCANQTDIDEFIDGSYTQLHLKLFTQQYNTTSKQVQVNFKNYMMFPQSSQYIINSQNIQNQITKVRDGFVIQQEEKYTAPIQYVFENQSFPNYENPYIQVNLQIDEVIQYTSIQFSTFPAILALVNSAFSLLLLLGFFCRSFANKSILQDFFCVFLQNMHQNLYEEVLKQNKLFEQKATTTQIETKANKLIIGQEIAEREVANNINIHQFTAKSIVQIEQNVQTQINTTMNNIQEEISKSEDDKKTNVENQSIQIKKYSKQLNNQKTDNKNQRTNTDVFQYNNTILTSASNDIKNQNDSYQEDILKASPRIQLSPLKTDQSEIQTQRGLICLSKIPYSASIVQKSERQTNTSLCQKDATMCLTQNQFQQSNQIIQQNQQKIQDNQKPKLDKKDILSTPKRRINTIEYYIQKFRTIQDLNIFQKFTQINFGYRFTLQKLNCFRKKDDEDQDQKSLSVQQKTFIEQQVLKSMNVLELLKDVIFIKKAIMILLTKDQLAAIKLVGYTENYIQDTYLQKNAGKHQRQNTYFEKQLDIFDSTELSCQYIKKFIQKCNSSKTLDKVDERILSSINKNTYNLC
ncbi:transmembrane protein, putative (macronuclear) [Tetrahymena thermophila SB210]|uniref:Transmembrane protein, putative n=1 Tax=Tetrahymena thermophila (strain SB210) TaxID=312017 RepID=Q23JL3_TETTS|nr:transmembrane protein, putative [Tetrahymena thermophila SB210]EAR96730.2 transmembrane protein, putative [Tetrahymena thermophila SB210]|eukprot:XP_001016975.2 transmembrane protein, putative [Tetrahymena thermophila SB210]